VSDWKDPDQVIADGVCGRPEDVVSQLRAFWHAGAERVYLQLFDLTDLDQLELIAKEVLPHLPDGASPTTSTRSSKSSTQKSPR
jgi:alkanesulfonate monooxygenase SsuD/methylene tetrahydromethanopterin reductase-like flavin-dependent oxidoreductase (luciferase family)